MQKVAENHWVDELFEIKLIEDCWFAKPNVFDRKHCDAANNGLSSIWNELGITKGFAQLLGGGKGFPTEEETREKVRLCKIHGYAD